MIWYVEENKRKYPTVIPIHGILLSGMLRKTLESKNVQVLVAEKKSAWTDLDRVDFEKIFQRGNVQIEKLAWTGLGKVKRKASSAASVFKRFSGPVTWGSPMRSALRWPALDKRCSSCLHPSRLRFR